MSEYLPRARFLYAAMICALALPLAGWATGQTGQVRPAESTTVFTDDSDATVRSVPIYSPDQAEQAGAFLIEVRNRTKNLHARREVDFIVSATDADGVLVRNARLEVDYGDGRRGSYPFDRREAIAHTWRQKGSYKIKFRLTDSNGKKSTGKTRVKVGPPLFVFLEVLGEDKIGPEEEIRWRFTAVEREASRLVSGSLTVDWGDGTQPTTIDKFTRDASRPHTYDEEGDYTITATLTSDALKQPKSVTFDVTVAEVGGPIDLSSATVASNSDQGIANFKVTSAVTNVTISRSLICIYHTKAGQWPVRDGLEGNPWVAAFLDGKLHAGTYEFLRPGQVCKALGVGAGGGPTIAHELGPHIKAGPLAQWIPKLGETVYLWVSTLARLGQSTSNERAEPVATTWPY